MGQWQDDVQCHKFRTLVSLSLLVSASSLPQMVGTTLPTSKSPWQMGTPCNWIVQSSQILNPEKGFIHIFHIICFHIFISSYLSKFMNFLNIISPSKQSNPTPTFPALYSVPRYQRPRPMELRTGRRGRRGSRSSRSFQRSTFQRPLLHLENSQGITCVPFPTKRWDGLNVFRVCFILCMSLCQWGGMCMVYAARHVLTSVKIMHLEEVLKLEGIDSCDVLSFETHIWKSLWISFGFLGLKNSSETSQNAKCWGRNVSPWLLQNKAGTSWTFHRLNFLNS